MKIIILDRDGVLISEPQDNIVDSLDKVVLFPEEIEALSSLSLLDYKFFCCF